MFPAFAGYNEVEWENYDRRECILCIFYLKKWVTNTMWHIEECRECLELDVFFSVGFLLYVYGSFVSYNVGEWITKIQLSFPQFNFP